MSTKRNFQGIIPPVSIIFDTNGELDKKGMADVIDFLIDAGVDGLFFLGSGGEFSQMSRELRMEVAAFTTEYVNKRVPVLIGTGSPSTHEAITLSKHAEEIGADGIVVINPYYWPLTEENLLVHYGEIAEAVNLPILLYNYPDLTGQNMSPEFVLKLIEKHPNIVGIKDTIDSVGHIHDMILTVKGKYPEFTVLAGFDNHLLNTLSLGGDGAICASINFAPELAIGVYNAFYENDMETAVNLYKRLAILPTMYKLDSPFISVVKEAMKLKGLDISTHVLPPTRMLDSEKQEKLQEILKKAELL
ncbi:dihydrodipicolinate synthase family protein [Virgibacillus sp. NKC19-16]|uniref:dihydrodipicolinate synthase family protein n=1 Tax=Virgibacillus salidurans TaxID=2831673 RepID=UPI001F27ECDC|nr:dihydrodipicolinate synthase family protein [Virgibacillus sp. NKC19-16]UJL47422.1 dihydrodipicolinate synthase family protein [Virgibacillus sp. NKC19-16]